MGPPGWAGRRGPEVSGEAILARQKKNLRGRFLQKKEKRERFRSRRERTFLSVCPSVFCLFCVCLSPSPQRCIFLTAADTSSRRRRRRRADRRRSSSRRGVVSLQRKRSLQKYRGLSSENWRMLPLLLLLLLGRRPPFLAARGQQHRPHARAKFLQVSATPTPSFSRFRGAGVGTRSAKIYFCNKRETNGAKRNRSSRFGI